MGHLLVLLWQKKKVITFSWVKLIIHGNCSKKGKKNRTSQFPCNLCNCCNCVFQLKRHNYPCRTQNLQPSSSLRVNLDNNSLTLDVCCPLVMCVWLKGAVRSVNTSMTPQLHFSQGKHMLSERETIHQFLTYSTQIWIILYVLTCLCYILPLFIFANNQDGQQMNYYCNYRWFFPYVFGSVSQWFVIGWHMHIVSSSFSKLARI